MTVRFSTCVSLLVLCGAASAGTVTINDLTDIVSVTGDIGNRLDTNCSGETCLFSFVGPPGNTGFTLNFPGGANLIEPGATNASDTLANIGIATEQTTWSFTSDAESGLPLLTGSGINTLTEDGTPQSVIVVSWFNSLTPLIQDTIVIQSDLEVAVPEPSTWWMALSGLALLVLHLRRRLA